MSIARHHAEWLSLVPVSGPFLSLPVLMEAFPQGLEPHDPDQSRLLRQEYGNWEESLQKHKGDPAPHQRWIKFVLTKTLELDERVLAEGQAIPQTLQAEVPEHHELLRPNIVVIDPNTKKPRLLVQIYPRSQELTSYVANSRWKASPDTRMTELLHATGVRLGLLTNGEHWMLVDAPKGETTGYSSWYASLWLEEKITLQAFRSLLSASRFFNVPDDQTLEALFTKSASNQQEITDQLGYQVRRAVEVLIHSLDRADQDNSRELLAGVKEEVLYESALTVMMRLVFLFCAEERELIPSKPFPVYEQNYSVSMISKQLRELADQHGEELLERRFDAWSRLLSAFRAVYGGLQHDDVHIPAYGGSLFNPDRFPFLEGRKPETSWRDTEADPLPVNNRTVLHLLEALQLLQIKVPGNRRAEARRLSFRALDIEQIGHVYEGLLDHTAKRANEPFLGLAGTREKEPEIPLAELEEVLAKSEADLVKFLRERTGKTDKAIAKSLNIELEQQDASRFRTACQSDDDLWNRVKPFAGLVRLDNFGYPVVIPKGSVFVTAGTDRRSSGTHYTPRSLTEPIVQYTMEPLVYVGPAEGKPKNEWKLKSAKELLDLKICDMACGSGAFLVQSARYMADRLMESWDVAKQANPITPGITPDGTPSTGSSNESLIPDDPAERKTYAMRIIAQRCLYGVDKNPLAAEMAKLSLWLLTLAKDKPFEFLDHSIRCGDSLVGLHDINQLQHFSLKPDDDDAVLFKGPLDKAVNDAIDLRLKLEDLPSNTVEDVERQEKLLKEANEKIARLRCAADLLVAAEYWGESWKDKLERLKHAEIKSVNYFENGPTKEFETVATKERRGQLMFHWPLEFPEVIVMRGGFDAFVGNPPFMGGKKITGLLSVPYRDYIVANIAAGIKGNADLCVYFILRSSQLTCKGGMDGFITTNTVGQGETREVGLDQILSNNLTIPRAVSSKKWPGVATVEIAYLWIRNGTWQGSYFLDDANVPEINSLLQVPSNVDGNPYVLLASTKKSFQGSNIVGVGFTMSPEEAQQIIKSNEKNRDVLFPYLNGEDLNSRPDQTPSRWVVNFFDWPLDRNSCPEDYEGPVAADYPESLQHVITHVKPYREELGKKNDASAQGYAKWWWQYGRKGLDLYKTIRAMDRVLVRSQVSRTHAPVFFSPDIIFSMMTVVFALKSTGDFAVIQSNFHESWLTLYGSSLRTDQRYTPTSCFETFPFPSDTSTLQYIGDVYHNFRKTMMLETQEGLTKTYNRFHNPNEISSDIQRLRELHSEIDRSVASAYRWNELSLDHGFHETKQGIRFTISESARREVLQRLLQLNHERYAEEVKQGLRSKKIKPTEASQKPRKKIAKATVPTPSLFDLNAFPSTKQDEYLCGLVCELVVAEPGMAGTAYRDALVIALGRHKDLLIGNEQETFVKLCKSISVTSKKNAQKVPWNDLKSVLIKRKAIFQDEQSLIQRGPELDSVRKSYPQINSSLVLLLLKAAAELRELQARSKPPTTKDDKILAEFESDQKNMCGVSP